MFIDFRERGSGSKTDRQTDIDVGEKHRLVASCTFPTEDRTCNQGMCPDQGLNTQHFGVWDYAPTSWVTQSGPNLLYE